jgi:hypothetical protein
MYKYIYMYVYKHDNHYDHHHMIIIMIIIIGVNSEVGGLNRAYKRMEIASERSFLYSFVNYIFIYI